MRRVFLSIILIALFAAVLCACEEVGLPQNVSPAPATDADHSKEVYVYFIGGQSNAAGNGYLVDLSKEERKVEYEHVYFYSDGECLNPACKGKLLKVCAQRGQGHYAYSFGLEVGLAKIFTEEYAKDGVKRAIIKYAYDGSSIKSYSDGRDWNVYDDAGTGAHYDQFIKVAKAGLKALEEEGYTPVIKGMAWMQGETDYLVSDYQARLEALRDKVRIDLDTPDMGFVMGEIAYANYGKINYVNNAIRKLQKKEPDLCRVVECGGVATRCKESECPPYQTQNGGPFDHLHWSGEELVQIGKMFGSAFVSLEG